MPTFKIKSPFYGSDGEIKTPEEHKIYSCSEEDGERLVKAQCLVAVSDKELKEAKSGKKSEGEDDKGKGNEEK